MTGPRRDYLHARLPVHLVRLRSAPTPGPSGHARTRLTNARPTAGVTVIWRAAVPYGRSPAANSVPKLPPLQGDTGRKHRWFTAQTEMPFALRSCLGWERCRSTLRRAAQPPSAAPSSARPRTLRPTHSRSVSACPADTGLRRCADAGCPRSAGTAEPGRSGQYGQHAHLSHRQL
jgi:hypothetical protein